MRTPFGFVIGALAERERTLSDLAALLDVSKQAAIKVVDEMERHGFLSRAPHPTDRRVKQLALTDQGRAVYRAALAASHEMEAELRDALGDGEVEAMRAVLTRFPAGHGGLEDAGAGRSRALW